MVIPMMASPNVGHAIVDFFAVTDAVDDSGHTSHFSHSNAAPQSESDNAEHDSDCCHDDCVCCTARFSLITTIQAGISVNTNRTLGLGPTNLPNPHLKGLLRPPRFG